MIPKTALEYFVSERNKRTEPYQKLYDEIIELLQEKSFNNKEMKTMKIKILISTFVDVNEIVRLASLCEDEVLVYSNRYIVSAKSIMGMYSLDLSKPIEIEFPKHIPNEVKEGMKKFIVN